MHGCLRAEPHDNKIRLVSPALGLIAVGNRRSLGDRGERAAIGILEREGYRVLETNYSSRYGEIDIVADEGGWICFVEVRLRSSDRFGSALESLTRRKRDHLRKTAQIFLARRGQLERDHRFDFLALDWDRQSQTPRSHVLLKYAFGADD